MTEKTVLLMTNLDTRGPEFLAFRDLVLEQGLNAILLDFSMEQAPKVQGDITCEEVARAGGLDIESVRAKYQVERKTATDCMIRGARAIVGRLAAEGRIQAVFGAGGGTSTLISTSVMKLLPFGFPKVMASSIASHPRFVDKCVGTRDITMLNTVVDVMGSNALLDRQLRNGVAAVCGMARLYEPEPAQQPRPVVAVTSFGFAERCVEPALGLLREQGFEPVPFHSQGRGDRALDELIREGAIAGVLDLVPRGLGEELLGGNGAAGPDRILAAAESGVPQVVAPSGLDMVAVGGQAGWEERFAGRSYVVIDELRVLVRTSPEECRAIARRLAECLNISRAPYLFLLPLRGWSSLDSEGRGLFDPAADEAFHEELLLHLARPERIREIDANLYSSEFAAACVEAFCEVWQQAGLPLPCSSDAYPRAAR